MSRLIALALTVLVTTVSLHAHGGQFRPPGDAGSATGSSGGNSAPPTNPEGGAAPGPGTPATGGRGASFGGGGRTRGGGDPRRAQVTGLTQVSDSVSADTWDHWWNANQDALLDLRASLEGRLVTSGTSAHFTGQGRKESATWSRRPSAEQVRVEVLPTLLRRLAEDDDRDVLDSSALAAARSARAEDRAAVLSAVRPLLTHGELSVQTSATLALGVLGSPTSVPTLIDLMSDTSTGRQLTGGGQVHWLVRAFAALSLGLVDDADAVDALVDLIDRTPDAERDLKACAVVALGLMENPRRPEIAVALTRLLRDRRLDPTIKAYVPTSLGRLGDPTAIVPLHETLLDRDEDHLVRQSAAIALGVLAEVTDTAVVDDLIALVEEGRDAQTRHFALIALGRIGARDARPEAHVELHERLASFLGGEITAPGRHTHRSWAALAAALHGRGNGVAAAAYVERLRVAYDRERDPAFRSAFAIALGLLGDSASGPTILSDWRETRDTLFRGYAAIALGLLRHQPAAAELRAVCEAKRTAPSERLQTARALGVLADVETVAVLIDVLEQGETLGVSSAAAKALGLLGDRSAIGPLRELAEDARAGDLTRAFACVALGLVGERTDLPWNARISADNNYRARTPAIDEVLDIL